MSERERLIQTVALVLFSFSSLSFSPPPFGPTIFLPPENLPFHAGRRGRGGGRGVRSVRTGGFKGTGGCVIRMRMIPSMLQEKWGSNTIKRGKYLCKREYACAEWQTILITYPVHVVVGEMDRGGQ